MKKYLNFRMENRGFFIEDQGQIEVNYLEVSSSDLFGMWYSKKIFLYLKLLPD